MNLLEAVSDRSYLVLTFRMRTSALSRAILVRRFARTETLTFLSGTGTCTVTYVTLHEKTGKKVMTRARYFNTLDKRKFL